MEGMELMVKKIMHDPLFLAQKSVDATEADKQIVTDLLDTLRANLEHCVGMAANMIGVKKNIIVVAAGPFQFAMINPIITKKSGVYQTEEGCLSLKGVRPCTRYQEIEVDYLDQNFKKQHGKYSGWTAQIIQHEIERRICYSKCPQKCIDLSVKPLVINQANCLHCGNCMAACPFGAVEKR